jgi:hypothetical protein
MKTLINARKNLSLMSVKEECEPKNELVNIDSNYNEIFQDSQEVENEMILHESVQDPILQPMVESKTKLLVNIVQVNKDKSVVESFSFTYLCSVLLLSFILVNGLWL